MKIYFHKTLPEKPCFAIVALSSGIMDDVDHQRGLQVLRDTGCKVISYYQHENRFQRFAASDSERIAQLNAALDNPEVDVIMALRGGYGLSRILPKIDFNKIAQSGKLMVGYSDFNALQLAMLAKTGTASLCGPVLCTDFSRASPDHFTLEDFFQCLRTRQHRVQFVTDT
ncbi:MAG: LD-carboxypeptidase, partial [Undibacterium sp.]|nr:LD-carboxypeptidase [Undibacterium sp.]